MRTSHWTAPVAGLLAISMGMTGCYSTTTIPARELPRLLEDAADGETVEVTDVDGETAKVHSPFHLRVRFMREGQRQHLGLRHPVAATIVDETLELRANAVTNRLLDIDPVPAEWFLEDGALRLSLAGDSEPTVEVRRYSHWRTGLVVGAAVLATAFVTILVVFSSDMSV